MNANNEGRISDKSDIGRLTVPLDLDTGPAKETKIVAPQAMARWRAGSSSRVPVMMVTFSLLLIELGNLVGLRA